jgi:adenylate kinase
MKNIVLMGPPGAGKGTQAKLLAEKHGLIHLSTGDLVREEQAKGSKIGKLATELCDKGNFLPDEIVTTMVKQKIIDNPKVAGFIFDGYPRTIDQAKSLDDFLNKRQTPVSKIIIIDIADHIIKERILERAAKENRPDDSAEVIQTRITNYKKQTKPVIDYYKNSALFAHSKAIINIEGAKTKEEVLADLEAKI